jgi:DNA repair protein RecO (recombination protein O)
MAILKTEAVVLKGWRLGETSKILSLFTREHGKIKVVAKGALGPKSKFKGCVESLSHIAAVYYEKRTRELQLLSQADLVDGHVRILGDMERTALAFAGVELVDKAVETDEPLAAVFELLVSFLSAMNGADGFLEGYLWKFEGGFIGLMGYQPTWDRCLDCGGSLGSTGGFFQPASGGLLCRACGAQKGGLRVEGGTLEILYWLERAEPSDVGRLRPSQANKAEIRRMFDLYFKTHIEHMRSLKSLGIYYQMESRPFPAESDHLVT